MAGEPRIDIALLTEIDQRFESLAPGSPATSGGSAWTTEAVDAEVVQLRADRAIVIDHYSHLNTSRMALAEGGAKCQLCGVSRPCPVMLELVRKYGVSTWAAE